MGTSDVQFRPHQPADRAAVESVMREALVAADAFVEDAPEEGNPRLDPAYYEPPAGTLLVAELDGEIVATGGFRRPAGLLAERYAPVARSTAELKRLHVHPDYQRRGIASDLLARLERLAIDAGYATMVLSTTSMQQAAVAFYAEHGYERFDRSPVPVESLTFDLLYFRRSLGDGPESTRERSTTHR